MRRGTGQMRWVLGLMLVAGVASGCGASTTNEAASEQAPAKKLLIGTDAVVAGPANNLRDAKVARDGTMFIVSQDERGSSPTDGVWTLKRGEAAATQLTKVARPGSIAIAANGTIYLSLPYASTVKILNPTTGALSDLAGNGARGYSGDGGNAANATFNYPWGLAVSKDTLYVADTNNQRIRSIDLGSASHTVNTVVGTGVAGFSGDGGDARQAKIHSPGGLAVDGQGDLYFGDVLNQRIRFVDFGNKGASVISTLAGTGTAGFSGDGGPATAASLDFPWGVAVSSNRTVTIADTRNNRIRTINKGVITTIAGTGALGYSGDGGAAIDATMAYPWGISYEADPGGGNEPVILFADSANHAVRELDNKLDGQTTSAPPKVAAGAPIQPAWPVK